MILKFNNEDYTISNDETVIQLLKKEYELLDFLYTRAERSFTRNQLLEAVWPMANPIDRTVDDHVYRLRKKTKNLEGYFVIQTIKGYGYRLKMLSPQEHEAPAIADEEFREISKNLLNKYHRYGQGNAVKTLLQSKTLGIQAPPETQFIYLLIEGDWRKLLHTEELDFSEKVLFLIQFDLLIGYNRSQSVQYYVKAVEKDVFSPSTQEEATLLFPIFLYIFAKDYEKAARYLERAEEQITSPHHGFFPFLQLSRLMYHISLNELEQVKTSIETIETLFEKFNYQRELSLFVALKGIWKIGKGNKTEGRKSLEEGVRIAESIEFESHLLFLIAICLFFLENHADDSIAYKQMRKQWDLLDEKYDFDHISDEITNKMNSSL